jgi:transposase
MDIADLQRLAKKENEGRVRIRMQGIVMALQGMSGRAIGEVLGVNQRTVRDWASRYNKGGVEGLREKPGRGRKRKLKAEDVARFRERIDAGALPEDGVCTLRGLDIQRILEQEFGVVYTVSGVYLLLHSLGYSSLMPRPQHIKSDPVVQEEFKKKSART